MIRVEWDANLIESAVGEAIGVGEARAYHAEREPIYELADPEARERAFAELARRWFQSLGFHRPILQALAEHPLVQGGIDTCVISRVSRAQDEGAELFGNTDEERPRLLVRLRPASFRDVPALLALLRRELIYVSDMIDPEFGYRRELPPSPAGQTHDRLVMDRYSLLWATSVTGRLARAGRAPPAAREVARGRFEGTFSSPELFLRLFDGPRPVHDELVTLARGAQSKSSSCALCAMPTRAFAELMAAPIIDRIRADFPAWNPGHGICPQCAGLYESRCGDRPDSCSSSR